MVLVGCLLCPFTCPHGQGETAATATAPRPAPVLFLHDIISLLLAFSCLLSSVHFKLVSVGKFLIEVLILTSSIKARLPLPMIAIILVLPRPQA